MVRRCEAMWITCKTEAPELGRRGRGGVGGSGDSASRCFRWTPRYFHGPLLGEGAYGEVYAMFHRSLGVGGQWWLSNASASQV